MRRSSVLMMLPAIVGLSVFEDAAAQDSHSAIRGVIEAHARFSQARNLTGADTLWSHAGGVHIIEGAGVNHGWPEYRDEHLQPELDRAEEFRYRYHTVEPIVRGNVAWASFQYDLFIKMDGRDIERVGRGTAVLERQDGRWVIVHMHTSGRAPQPQN